MTPRTFNLLPPAADATAGATGPSEWDAESCGLVSPECARLLDGLYMGAPEDRARMETRVLTDPAAAPYAPYLSRQVPPHGAGEAICDGAIEAVFADEVSKSVLAGPLTQMVRTVVASLQATVWSGRSTPVARGLALLADLIPGKGGEVQRLLHAYGAGSTADLADVIPMIVRDFYSSVYSWQFIRGDGASLDLCGSAMCLTTAIDYPGAADDPGAADRDSYLKAAHEGVGRLSGGKATRVLREIVICNAFIRVKDEMARQAAALPASDDPHTTSPAGTVTPADFRLIRWWDGAMTPHHRMILSTDAYRHVTDEQGTFTPTDRCAVIRRAVDSLIRYNEITDLVTDLKGREPCNELLIAMAAGGPDSAAGYAAAITCANDEVLACDCGRPGHEETAEFEMGACVWYLLTPRYLVHRQLLAFSAPDSPVAEAYTWRPPGQRLRPLARIDVEPGTLLHAPDWSPLWQTPAHDPAAETSASDWAKALAARAVRRCLAAGTAPEPEWAACEAAAASLLARCDALADLDQLRGLAEDWAALFDQVLAASAATAAISSTGAAMASRLRPLVARIWQHTVIGSTHPRPAPAHDEDERLFLDVDQAVRNTYRLPDGEGWTIRRAFFGIVSSAVELTGLGPYERLADGAAAVCRDAATANTANTANTLNTANTP